MPPIQRVCKITGKKFEVSELEQKLREQFGAPLPDTHPYERMRRLLAFRNVYTLYNDNCDLCGKHTLSIWGENPKFPVYCSTCWASDKWQAPEANLDLDKPFFEQLKELYGRCGRSARVIQEPFVNSDYCNAATGLKNCYMCFNSQFCEDSQYLFGCRFLKNSLDTVMTKESAEFLSGCISCPQSYQLFWSEFAVKCSDSYFLYDCMDCNNCALSTGLRHKSYVFMNQQLTKEQYANKIKDLQNGSFVSWQKYWQQFQDLKKVYPKKAVLGLQNENVSGNIASGSKDVIDSYDIAGVENSANVSLVTNIKDSLDVASFGGTGAEKVYSCTQVGNKIMNIQLSFTCLDTCHNLTYCIGLSSSHDCFGCVFTKKSEFAILNKKYSQSEYEELIAKLKSKMIERGEYWQMFSNDLIPFAYNETMAQLFFPLDKSGAQKLGFRWVDKKIPTVPTNLVLNLPDSINDLEWSQVEGKFVICPQSGRPFKLTKPEFEFYKKFSIPVPRLHPDVRFVDLYPRAMMFNLHQAKCNNCAVDIETSHPEGDLVLCDKCYLDKVQ